MILIFDLDKNLIMTCDGAIPGSHEGDDYIRVSLKDDEEYDSRYSYSLVDGVAVKGDLISEDLDEIARLDAEFQAIKYREDRKNIYPDIGDQLDDLFHAGAFSDDMAAKIQAVKDAHPKPEE